MGAWPDFELERVAGALLRVDLYEQRYLAVGDYHNVVNHLLRSASAACLSDREADALLYVARAARRNDEWVRASVDGTAAPQGQTDFARVRGWLAVALAPNGSSLDIARTFVAATANAAIGPVHNARMVAYTLLGDAGGAEAASRKAELTDPGLGVPLKRFILALHAQDEAAMRKALSVWVQEKIESTMTHEWGAYNEVPIEVSGALALAEAVGRPLRIESDRVFTRYRA